MNSFIDLIKFKFRKIQKNLWVFTSFNGDYSDSPLYLSNYLAEHHPEIKIVWLVKNCDRTAPENVTFVPYSDENLLYYRSQAEVIVDNVNAGSYCSLGKSTIWNLKSRLALFLKKKKGQRVYSTWHGIPLKKMERDQKGVYVKTCIANPMTMILKCDFEKDILDHITFEKIKMISIGSPRNDVLFNPDVSALKEKLGLPADKKIVLFAPTFRNEGKSISSIAIERSGLGQINEMDCDKLFSALKDKFGGDFLLVCRFHYHVVAKMDWEKLNERFDNKIINGNKFEDMGEYLACTDVLITDASSCMFDFMLTKRPCFLYFPDADFYGNEERGFYKPLESLPFPCSKNFDGMLENIKAFDNEKYLKGVEDLKKEFNMKDDGQASEKIIDYILEDLKK